MNKITNSRSTPKFLQFIFIPILFELVIGGGGRYFEIGPLTIRMLFFVISIGITFLIYNYYKAIKKNIIIIIIGFTFLTILGFIIGYVTNAPIAYILEDIKPLSFMYMLLFFSLTIRNVVDIEKTIRIIKWGSIFLGGMYAVVLIMLITGQLAFLSFYAYQSEIGEIMFRNEILFFYKGFLYLCIGFFFFLLSKGTFSKLGALFLFICIVLTLTRGFILFTTLITLYYILFIGKNVLLKWGAILVSIFMVIILIPIILESSGDKSTSDKMRYLQIEEVFNNVNPLSLIVGHGFGNGVSIRPVHMELSFLEIFHKQGLIGITFWVLLLGHIFLMYFNIKNKYYRQMAAPFFYGVVFVVLQSGTNPYINNPIGLTMILITIVVFSRLLELQREAQKEIV